MQNLQEVFNRIQENKAKAKELKKMYKEGLDGNGEYQEIQDKMKTLRENKKRIETAVKEQFSSEIIKLEDLKIDIETDSEMLADIALTSIMKGETVAITDKDNNEYEPIFKVNFKKIV